MNPKRRRRRKRARSRRGFFASNPHRRYRRHRKRSYRMNPRPRHRRYRSRRRSFGFSRTPAVRTIANDIGWAAAGFMSTKVVGNMVSPMIAGAIGDQPIVRIGLKLGVAYLSAWGLSSFMGSRVFMPAMLGGSLEAIQDAVKTFIAPTFPMLAANYEPLELYYEPQRFARGRALSAYPEYGDLGDGLSPDHDAVV